MSAFAEVSDITGSKHIEATKYKGVCIVRVLGQYGGEKLVLKIAEEDLHMFFLALFPEPAAEAEGEG